MQEIAFNYKEDALAPDDFAVTAAQSLFYYPPEETIRGPYAVEWDPSVVKKYLDMLQPERSIVLISSSSLAAEAGLHGSDDNLAEGWQREQWYKAPYREEPIPPQRLESWQGSGGNWRGSEGEEARCWRRRGRSERKAMKLSQKRTSCCKQFAMHYSFAKRPYPPSVAAPPAASAAAA